MEVILNNIHYLKKAIDLAKTLSKYVHLSFGINRVIFENLDEAHIVVFSYYMPADAFSTYNVSSAVKMGVELASLKNIIDSLPDDAALSFISERQDELIVRVTSRDCVMEFVLESHEIEESLEIPHEECPSSAKLPSVTLKRTITTFSRVGMRDLETEITSTAITFRNANSNIKGCAKFFPNEEQIIKTTVKEGVCKSYSGMHMDIFFRKSPLGNYTTLSIRTAGVLQIVTVLEDKSYMEYYIAPKATDDN
jgi:DNA polymerase III sliding clamp (beta) subunit (PCNA family)